MTDGPLRRLLGHLRRQADPASDAGLLERYAAAGDEAAFELLVWRHGGLVLGVCRRVLGDPHSAEDAFQATFLALARQAKAIHRREALAGWLHRVAHRIASRARAQAARRSTVERRAAVGVLVGGKPPDDVRGVIDEELDRLPARLRAAVVLCYLEGLTTEEAGRRLGCPRGTVLSRLAAARARLRSRLTRRGLALPAGGLAAALTPAEAAAMQVAPAVRTAVALAVSGTAVGVAAPQVIGWADGALRAMMLSKLQWAAGALLAAGMLGLGGTWVAGPGSPGVVYADDPPAKVESKPRTTTTKELVDDVRRQRDIETQRRGAERRRVDEVRAAMAEIEQNIAKHQDMMLTIERDALRVVAEHRLKVMAAEDQLRQVERERNTQRDNPKDLEQLESEIRDLETKQQQLASTLGDKHPQTAVYREPLEKARQRLAHLKQNLPARLDGLEKALMRARKEFIEAEVEYRLAEQRANLERQRVQRQLTALDERWRLLSRPQVEGPRDHAFELERKLDELIQEVKELRREIKK